MQVHHIGIVVKNIQKSIYLYQKIGYIMCENIITDMIQNNRVAFLYYNRSTPIELIEPLNEKSSVYNFKEGYHHICYRAEKGEDIIGRFKEMNIGKIFTNPIIAPALHNQLVVFACLSNKTFIELIL